MLQEANEGLSELNLSYEKLLAEYRKEKMQAEKLARELKEVSVRDYLTGLYNRRYLFDFLDKEVRRAKRYGVCFSIMIFDIDFFKKINDSYGHQSGDLVLKAVSGKATSMIRGADLLARYGGEEFVVVMPQTEASGAATIAGRLREAVEGMAMDVAGQPVKVTISIGVASYVPQSGKLSVEEFIDRADKALYDAKNSGRNRVVIAK
jgi:diguanylate cyclase (GGDEF)-like protein